LRAVEPPKRIAFFFSCLAASNKWSMQIFACLQKPDSDVAGDQRQDKFLQQGGIAHEDCPVKGKSRAWAARPD
jgi:hypothetical protein